MDGMKNLRVIDEFGIEQRSPSEFDEGVYSRVAKERQQSRYLGNSRRLLCLVELFEGTLAVVDRASERVQLHDEHKMRAGDVDLGKGRIAHKGYDIAVLNVGH